MSWLDDVNPVGLEEFASAIGAGGEFRRAISTFQFGAQQREAGQFAAQQMRQMASDELAASQRSAWSVDRQSQYIASHALATAAASGGGASDPTVVNLIARNAAEGAYRQQLALYQGQERARYLELQAQGKEYEGALAESHSNAYGMSQIFSGGATLVRGAARARAIGQETGSLVTRGQSMLSRFGNGGPRMPSSPFYDSMLD